MGKRKTVKKQIKQKSQKISTIFDCPYCNHKNCVETKIVKKSLLAYIFCKVCGVQYRIKATTLSEPVDIYCQWLDESDKINNTKADSEEEDKE